MDAVVLQAEPTLAESMRRSFQRICAADHALRKASMVIGWEGAFLKRNEGWRYLDFADEHAMRAAAGVSRSNWYRLVGIAEALRNLTREQFLAMSIENAEQLANGSIEQRQSQELVAMAATATAEEFAALLVADTAVREGKPVRDVMVTWNLKLRHGQLQVIRRGVKTFCERHGITDEVLGLEYLAADTSEHASLVRFIRESISRLTGAVREAKELVGLQQACVDYIREMEEILKFCLREEDDDSSFPS